MIILPTLVSALSEYDRVEEYNKRGHVWPPKDDDFVPNTPGWRQIMRRRLDQVHHISEMGQKYNGFVSAVYSSMIAKNFTENGWALTRAPQNIVDELKTALMNGMENDPEEEGILGAVEISNYPGKGPLFVNLDDELKYRLLNELKPIHEAWTNTTLLGNNAYGLRVYRNESNLNMHVDQKETHIISSILHVDHDPNGDPWPIVIEDFQGNLNEVHLESGDMLLYESSKCYHGRPKKFNGRWYSSVFIHYYPYDWDPEEITMDTHYRIPPTWYEEPVSNLHSDDHLVVVETSVKEPNCEHGWCGMKETVQWDTTGIEGSIISSDGIPKTLSHDEL